jgi:sugar phosphate permease
LPDLAFTTSTTVAKYTVIFFCSAVGSFVGSWTCGYFIDHFQHSFFLPFVLVLHSVCYYCIPMTSYIAVVAASISITGFTSATIATTGNVAILDIWNKKEERKRQGSILQAFHSLYALGGVVSAPIAKPFLGVFENNSTNLNLELTLENSTGCSKSVSDQIRVEDDNLFILYSIISSIILFISFSILIKWKITNQVLALIIILN